MDDAEFDALMARYLERRGAGQSEQVSAAVDARYAAAQDQVNAAARERYAAAAGAYSPYAMAAVEVHSPDGRVFKVFADGSITGFPDESRIVNRIPALQRAAVVNSWHGGAPPPAVSLGGPLPQRQPGVGSGKWFA